MPKDAPEPDERKPVARNKKAFFRYSVEDRLEAGIVLRGSEVKSVRDGQVALADAYARFKDGELYLLNCHIAPYERAGYAGHEPMRPRKLLLHRQQLRRLKTRLDERGVTLVPLALYFLHGLLKVELGLCRGRRLHDKREDIRKRDAQQEMRRVQRGRV